MGSVSAMNKTEQHPNPNYKFSIIKQYILKLYPYRKVSPPC